MCVLGHSVEVKVLWTQLCMRMSTYIWTSMWIFVWKFLKFFQKLPSAYIFINCTNSSKFVKFVKIVFDIYLNFINYRTFLKCTERQVQNFKFFVLVKFTQFIHHLPKFLTHFLNDFKISSEVFPIIPLIFFSKFQRILLKTKTIF